MQFKTEKNLTEFNFWGGAKNHGFTYNELNELEQSISELFDENPTYNEINDLFWFEDKLICEIIGIDYENDYLNR